jgi:hypothetical protein
VDVAGCSPLAVSYRIYPLGNSQRKAINHIHVLVPTTAIGGSLEGFPVPGGAVVRAAAQKVASYREVLRGPPIGCFSSRFLSILLGASMKLRISSSSAYMHGSVRQAAIAREGLVWFSAHRRLGLTIARLAVGRQLASRLPLGRGGGVVW